MPQAASKPELLAPAGDWEALKAAVSNGADAVYFGLPHFNARFRAANFTLEALPETMDYLHARGVRGYVTFNTLIFADELPEAVEYLNAIVAAGVDAVIVQDFGLALLIQKLFPGLEVHASTQTTQTEARGIELLKTLGVKRVILARELSIADIAKVRQATDVPVEVFVHGALCVAYSGQCLTSEALGGRSANRGQCAQACRQPYELFVDGEKKELGDRAYLLSPQDLAAFDLVEPLLAAGVCSLKIEGRLKGGPYVAAATRTYRAALDAALAGQPFALPEQGRLDLEQTFSRGLFHGFLDGVNHQATAPARFPKHRGVKLGVAVGSTRQGVMVELEPRETPWEELAKVGDGLVFDESRPEENEPGGRIMAVALRSRPGQTPIRVELRFRREEIDPEQIKPGSLVWRTDDPAVKQRLRRTYAQDKPIDRLAVDFILEGAVGGPLTLTAKVDGRSASSVWPGPLVQATKRPATVESVRDQLGRLGDTPFTLGHVELQAEGALLLPQSVLNELRRQATAELMKVEGQIAFTPVPLAALAALRAELRGAPPRETPTEPQLNVLVRTLEQLRAVAEWGFAEGKRPPLAYCDFEDVRRYRDAMAIARANGLPVGLATLRIVKPGEENWLRLVAEAEPDLVLVRNLAALGHFKEQRPNLPLVADFSLNVVNDLSASWLKAQGFVRLTPGYDLNWEQFAALVAASEPAWFEPVVHYRMPMFHMEHCVFAAFLSEGKDWRDCGRPCDIHKLDVKDPSGARFPVIPDAGCRNTVYNAAPQSAAEYLGRMAKKGLRYFRLELLREEPAEAGRLIALYQAALAGHTDGAQLWRQVRALNQLGVTRGTLQLL